jgi:hypothetical protein
LDALATTGFVAPINPALKLLLPVYKDKNSLQSPAGNKRCMLGDLHYGPTALAIC